MTTKKLSEKAHGMTLSNFKSLGKASIFFCLFALCQKSFATSSVESAKKAILGEWGLQAQTEWQTALEAIETETYSSDGTVSGTYTLRQNFGSKPIVYVINWKSRYFIEESLPAINAVSIRYEGISKTVKVETKDALLMVQSGIVACKLKPNIVFDLSNFECPQISPSLVKCPTQYSIAQVTPTLLRFGEVALEGDNCSPANRPKTLSAGGLLRLKN